MNPSSEEGAEILPQQPDSSPKPFQCERCGAQLEYKPGTHDLNCGYCGHKNVIPASEEDIRELDFHAYLREAAGREETVERLTLSCRSCGAESTFDPHITAQRCPFCDMPVVATAASRKVLKPKGLLPFKIEAAAAKESYRKWIHGLWLAPNALKHRAKLDVGITGIYVPFWTYDAATLSYYMGQRGVHYYTTETRTRRVNGKTVTERVQVRRTRWYAASGTIQQAFNDVLIPSTRSLPDKLARALEPWDLPNLVPYQDEYLRGFRAESYQVGLEEGFESAKAVMDAAIRESARRDIGGDEQRVLSVKTRHDNVTFKHILLPVWLSAYRYKDKVYRFMVNARTGEVQGERPWSWIKIACLAILGGILLLLFLAFGGMEDILNNIL
jgi:DNA-directed RNA polymerase subunit RPC12/RpoP